MPPLRQPPLPSRDCVVAGLVSPLLLVSLPLVSLPLVPTLDVVDLDLDLQSIVWSNGTLLCVRNDLPPVPSDKSALGLIVRRASLGRCLLGTAASTTFKPGPMPGRRGDGVTKPAAKARRMVAEVEGIIEDDVAEVEGIIEDEDPPKKPAERPSAMEGVVDDDPLKKTRLGVACAPRAISARRA